MAIRSQSESSVPRGLVTASEWAWRSLVVGAVIAVLWLGLKYFSGVAIPLAVAILLTALLYPVAERLRRWRWPSVLAALTSLFALALVIGLILSLIGANIVRQWTQLGDKLTAAVSTLLGWLATGPLHIDSTQVDGYVESFKTWLNQSSADVAHWVADAGAVVGHFFAGAAIAVIASFFFLASGRRLWLSALTLVPRRYQVRTDTAALAGWASLMGYMRAQVTVAFVDAVGILIGALILGVPMPWALFAFTFITAFIPVLGAVMAGTLAAALALVSGGWVSALIMIGVTVLVVEAEGHFLQPILLGRAARLHPLAVLVGLAIGATLSGIVGALLVIPTLAFFVAFIRGIAPGGFTVDPAIASGAAIVESPDVVTEPAIVPDDPPAPIVESADAPDLSK